MNLSQALIALSLLAVGVSTHAQAESVDEKEIIGAGYDLKVFYDFQEVNVEVCESIAPQFTAKNRDAYAQWSRIYAEEIELMRRGYQVALDLRSNGDSNLRKRIEDFDFARYTEWKTGWKTRGFDSLSEKESINKCSLIDSYLAQLNPRSEQKVSEALLIVGAYLERQGSSQAKE